MSDVIADLRRDMQQRLNEIERQLAGAQELLAEREQIQAALARPPFASQARAATTKRTSASKGTPARKRRTRAPRGANREAVLTTVSQRPGVTAAEISDVTKISRAVTYNTLAKLVEQGQIEKTGLPGGQTGYKSASPAPATSGSA